MMLILKRCAFFVGGIAAIIILAVAIGELLPVAHRVSKSETFSVPPNRLWNSSMAVFNRTNDGSYAIIKADKPHRFITGITRKNLPFGGTWTYEFTGNDQGTTLKITERGEVYNPLFRFLSRFVFGYYGSMDKFFSALSLEVSRQPHQN